MMRATQHRIAVTTAARFARPLTRVVAIVAAASIGLSCGDSSPTGPPEAGTLTVALQTGSATDGALVLTLSGPPGGIGAISAAQPGLLVRARPAGTATKVLVVGDLAGGPLLHVAVPDVHAARDYTATIVELAGRDNAVRSTDGRSLSVRE